MKIIPIPPDDSVKQVPNSKTFLEYISKEKKVYSLTILGLMLGEFLIFKLFYPFPDFFSDSYSYLLAAEHHWNVNIWPIGYSRFLNLFSWLSHSGFTLVLFQYLIWSISSLYFSLTITYLFYTGKYTRILLCVFLFFNPLFLYLANCVTSDMLFISMSTAWLAELIWMLHQPRLHQVFVQAILMVVMFTFRYNAMIYPVIAAGVVLLSQQKTWVKALGIVSGPALIIPFVLWSSNANKQLTGTAQFPPILGGWQWGNNALYMRGFIDVDSTIFTTPETRELDDIARQYFAQPDRPQDRLASYVANFFLRRDDAPLKQYLDRHFQTRTNLDIVLAWGQCSPVFETYGKLLIKKYPVSFARYYLLLNTKNYFLPPLEKLEIYNMGGTRMWLEGQKWFHYKNPNLWCISTTIQGTILAIFPILFFILNGCYLLELIRFIRRRTYRKIPRETTYSMLIIAIFLGLNAGFSIFANIIVIRYQLFPMILFFTFLLLLSDYLVLYKSNIPLNLK